MLILAVTTYDLSLSFSEEVRCIWKGKFGIGTILYLSIRYVSIMLVLLEILAVFTIPGSIIVSAIITPTMTMTILNMISRGKYIIILVKYTLKHSILDIDVKHLRRLPS